MVQGKGLFNKKNIDRYKFFSASSSYIPKSAILFCCRGEQFAFSLPFAVRPTVTFSIPISIPCQNLGGIKECRMQVNEHAIASPEAEGLRAKTIHIQQETANIGL